MDALSQGDSNMLKQWARCCACGAVTDPDEHHCPVACANNERMESIFPSKEEMIQMLVQKKVWTKWPERLEAFLK